MKKTTTVTQQDLYFKVQHVIQSAKQTLHKLKTMKSPQELLLRGKFSKLGTKWDDPTTTQSDDLSEQIQQSVKMLTAYYAIDWFCGQLMQPEKPVFTINSGDKNKPDISFVLENGYMWLGKVFAAKTPYNNDKLFHNLSVLAKRGNNNDYPAKGIAQFIAYCSPEPVGKTRLECPKEGIVITNIEYKYVCTDISYKLAGDAEYFARMIHVTPREMELWVEKILARR